jgi:GH25 family lysozyme M1 (1,4-beta-N-acetylmuramidase)
MAGLSFGYARATSWNGTTIGPDPDFAHNWAQMKEAGLHRGAYHFLLTTVSPVTQAGYFVARVKECGLEPGDMLVCDSELPVAEADDATAAFCAKVGELAGTSCPVLVYTDHDTGQHLTSCTRWPLWIAWPQPGATAPAADIVAPWKDWRFWQAGEVGSTDADVWNGTDTELQAWLDTFLPPATAGVKRWRTLGLWSLNKEAADHGTTPLEMIQLAAKEGHVYKDPMKRYIAAADWERHVPRLTVLYAPER